MGTPFERLGRPVSSADTRRRHASARYTPEEREKYLNEWARNMVKYWIERIDKLRVNDTGSLRASIEGQLLLQDVKATITFQFYEYGKYVDDGTGREFGGDYVDVWGRNYQFSNLKGNTFASSRGGEGTTNEGQLRFLDTDGDYRSRNRLDKPKKVGPAWGGKVAGGHPRNPAPWYYKKYKASRYVLNELERAYYGESYQGMMATYIMELMDEVRILL